MKFSLKAKTAKPGPKDELKDGQSTLRYSQLFKKVPIMFTCLTASGRK